MYTKQEPGLVEHSKEGGKVVGAKISLAAHFLLHSIALLCYIYHVSSYVDDDNEENPNRLN